MTFLHTEYLHIYIPTYLPTYIHTYIHTKKPTCIHTCTHTHLHTYINALCFFLCMFLASSGENTAIHPSIILPSLHRSITIHRSSSTGCLSIIHPDPPIIIQASSPIHHHHSIRHYPSSFPPTPPCMQASKQTHMHTNMFICSYINDITSHCIP